MMKRILIRPSQWNYDKLQNRMFEAGYSYQALYREAFRQWRALAAQAGYSMDTWDMHPLETADVLWFIDLPAHRRDVVEARRKAPHALFVLQIFETPAVGPHFFDPRNHRDFDIVLTYDHRRCDERRYFAYRLPNEIKPMATDLPFAERRVCCMVNTNRLEGYFTQRQPGPEGLPVIGKALGGWQLGWRGFLQPTQGELYTTRRRLARAADRLDIGALDVYGPGWNGEPISWFPLYPNRPYRCRAGGVVKEDKASLVGRYRFCISFENFEGDRGWIGEKIFDSLAAGTVPVYRGDQSIHEAIPKKAMVHAGDFRDEESLLRYLATCPENEWRAMRDAGQAYLRSAQFRPFTSEAFAKRMMEVLEGVKAAWSKGQESEDR